MVSLLDPEERFFPGRLIATGVGAEGPNGPEAAHNKRALSGECVSRVLNLNIAE